MEFRFQPDLFQRGDTSIQAGPISIRIRCPAATNCQPGSPRGRINNPERVRKGGRYPRAAWQMRPRAEPDSRDARQRNAQRAWRCQGRWLRSAARSDDGSREPPQELSAWQRRSVQPAEVQASSFKFSIGYEKPRRLASRQMGKRSIV